MTAQPLALRYVTSFTCRAGATALGGASARYLAGVATMTRWARQLLRSLAATDNIHPRNNHQCSSLSGRSFGRIDQAPGGIFDPLFTGISANAAGIHAAICRHPHLRRSCEQNPFQSRPISSGAN
jgi:hypothetical protein